MKTIKCDTCNGDGVEITEYVTGGVDSSLSPWQEYRERTEVCSECSGRGQITLSDLDFLLHQEEVEEASSTVH